jgi:hypothetical protein
MCKCILRRPQLASCAWVLSEKFVPPKFEPTSAEKLILRDPCSAEASFPLPLWNPSRGFSLTRYSINSKQVSAQIKHEAAVTVIVIMSRLRLRFWAAWATKPPNRLFKLAMWGRERASGSLWTRFQQNLFVTPHPRHCTGCRERKVFVRGRLGLLVRSGGTLLGSEDAY